MVKTSAVWFGVMAVLIVGCTSSPVVDPSAQSSGTLPPASGTAPAQTPAPGSRTAQSTVTSVAIQPLGTQASTERSVYFDYDNFSIKPEFVFLLERHGQFLATHPSLAIKIEGHADERGSAEYNLALGQKRAQAVLNALKIYGAKTSQMEAISWGEERAKVQGHSEMAWAQNRRADLAYPR